MKVTTFTHPEKVPVIMHLHLPSLLERRQTRPLRQESATSEMLVAHLPTVWMVAAANCLSWLLT